MARKRQQQPFDYLVKVVIIGDSAVGKTNILLRYVNQQYKMSHISTIGVDFKIKTINIQGVKIKMQIWDTAGQQRFKTITQTYYKGAAGVVLVYSVADRKTFNNLQNWIKQINQTQPENMCKIIVGNKSDVNQKDRQVTSQEGRNLAKKYGVEFVQCSAKDNLNIPEVFQNIGRSIKKELFQGQKTGKNQGNNIKINTGKDKQPSKCQC